MDLPHQINQFGIRLLSTLLENRKADLKKFPNTILSPLGLYLVLAMAYIGGRGKTAAEMGTALGLPAEENSRLTDEILKILQSSTKTVEGIQTILANSLWAKQGAAILPEFEKVCRRQFLADVQTLDFASSGALDAINEWVGGKTNRKIEQIMQKIPANAVLYLINALYFKGVWKKPFDPADTQPGEFTCLDGKAIAIPMMHQTGRYAYSQTDTCQAIALPYLSDSVSLILALPTLIEENQTRTMLEFQVAAAELDWGKLLEDFHQREGKIQIPRFNVSSDIHLKQTLESMGMQAAFQGQDADFGAMLENPGGLYISDVLHKTCFEVNEEGSEAAAASKVELVSKSVVRRFTFHLNRPFFCVLLDRQTGTALFMGWVVRPD